MNRLNIDMISKKELMNLLDDMITANDSLHEKWDSLIKNHIKIIEFIKSIYAAEFSVNTYTQALEVLESYSHDANILLKEIGYL